VLLFVIGFVRLYRCPHLTAPLPVAVGLLAAAAYGSSAWVGGLGLAVVVASLFLAMTAMEQNRPPATVWMTNVALAALITVALVLPFLRDQWEMLGIRSSRIIEFALYPVFKSSPDSPWWVIDVPGYWLVLLVVSMPGVYPFGLVSMLMLAWRGCNDVARRWAVYGLAVAAPCFMLPQFLRSIIANNDFGWRLILPGMLTSIVFAAVFFARAFASRKTLLSRVSAAIGVLMVVTGALAGAWFYYDNALAFRLHPRITAQSRAFLDEPRVWEQVRRVTPPDDRVANNPLSFNRLTGWPTNLGWALFADRRSCMAGWESVRAFAPQRPLLVLEDAELLFRRIFAGAGSPDDVQRMRSTYGCDTVLVVPADGLWNGQDVLTASGAFRLADEMPGRWRIYRAIPGG
jgi:hypothetical protein